MIGGATRDTIFALSSGNPPAAIGVVRVSGPAAGTVTRALAGSLPEPRRASVCKLRDDDLILDTALVVWFPGPNTATGEDLAEFHLHGGRATVSAVLQGIAAIPATRAAQPGEFTRRALENGRIDLTEAEGLADLLSAETELQRRVALRISEGGLSRRVDDWRRRVLSLAARVEADIEFAEDEDLEALLPTGFVEDAMSLASEIATALEQPPAERLRDGLRVVIAGPPNAGKSTLINALAARSAALVSPIAGTTRDLIEVPVSIEGIPLILIDGAGLRETDDEIEQAGVSLAKQAIGDADLLLWLGEGPAPPTTAAVLHLSAKSDLNEPVPGRLAVSAHNGAGIPALRDWLMAASRDRLPSLEDPSFNIRQAALARAVVDEIIAATKAIDLLLVAEHLRYALRQFDALLGRAGVEDMLDALFSRFCIGK